MGAAQLKITGDKSVARQLLTDLANQRIGVRRALAEVHRAASLKDACAALGALIEDITRDSVALRHALGEDAAAVAAESTQKAIAAVGGPSHA